VLCAALIGCGDDESTTTGAPSSPPPPKGGDGDRGGPPPVGDGTGGVVLQKLGEFEQPLYVTQPPGEDRELFVVEQCGTVRAVRDGAVVERPFLDLSDRVTCGGEQGLLSIAFAPDYRRSGLVYADYTDTAGDTRVVEYRRSRSDPAIADPDSARELLFVDQPYSNHNGGLLLFGPDDLLYVGLGDGGSGGDPQRNGQDLSTLLGKILRIDPDPPGGKPYGIPRDNPHLENDAARPEIIVHGLRNPWRFSFDHVTGDLWIGDVGQDALEEIDAASVDELTGLDSGLNFGWSAFEGTERFNEDESAPGARPPVLEYGRDRGCSVTGGYVVRDAALRSLYGRYLYGDFCEGELRSFVARAGRPASDDRALGPRIESLSSFGEDSAGRIYAVSLGGAVYRLVQN
jgi:glucose/arabinose dehydrogenase